MSNVNLRLYEAIISKELPGCALHILQTITLDAPGGSLLQRTTLWKDRDVLARYDKAVGLFLNGDTEYQVGVDIPIPRSLADKEPDYLYRWHRLTTPSVTFGISEERLNGFSHRQGDVNNPVQDQFPWEIARRRSEGSATGEAEWKYWCNAIESQFPVGHWTFWVSLRLNARAGGNSKQRMYATAYVVGSGGINGEGHEVKLARILYELLAEETIDVHEGEIVRQTRAAAISQVLSRTMSHNLGSHSLNDLSNEKAMGDLLKHLLLKIDRSIIPGRISGESPPEWKDAIDQFTQWLARYNNYLRERMDFLADITTAVPAFETRTHFKDDLLKGFSDNHLLTTTIAGSPDFDYCWDPKIYTTKGDILVSIPSDVLGRHAFYVILENIVRNSSKHGAHHKGKPVTYSVEVTLVEDPKHKDMLRVTIKDNKCRPTQERKDVPITYCDEHKSLTVDEKQRVETIQELTSKRNEDINRPVLEGGRVRNGAWGMLEMKACAAYLRRVALEELDDSKYQVFIPDPEATREQKEALKKQHDSYAEPPLLEAVGDENGFGYAFYLLRPKDVMVIGENVEELFPSLDAKERESLSEFGIGLLSLADLAKKPVINHGLLVFQKSNDEGLRTFIRSLREDPNAMPHEILVAGQHDQLQLDQLFKAGSHSQTDTLVGSSTFCTSDLIWPGISSEKLGEWTNRLRRDWLFARMTDRKIGIADTVTNLETELGAIWLAKRRGSASEFQVRVDYATHRGANKFYDEVDLRTRSTRFDGPFDDLKEGIVADQDERVLYSMLENKAQSFVLRMPSALDRMMQEAKDPGTELANERLRQHHLAYWLTNTAVIDERIQAAVHADTYVPSAKSDKDREVIRIKHMLDLSGVFIPHKSMDLEDPKFTAPMWGALLKWLTERGPYLSYVYLHLSILEKFGSAKVIANVSDGLGQLKAGLPHARFIIVSGRGKPPSLPQGELFVSYSALSQYLTQAYQRSPVLLSILSRSARRLTQSR